jgi:hypothetical protein
MRIWYRRVAEQKAEEAAAAKKAAAAAKDKAQEEATAKDKAAKRVEEAATPKKKAKGEEAAAKRKAATKVEDVPAAAQKAQEAAPTRKKRFVPPDRRMRSAATQPLPTVLWLFCLRPLLRLRLDYSVRCPYLALDLVLFWFVCAVFLLTFFVLPSPVRVPPPRECVRIFCEFISSLCDHLFHRFMLLCLERFVVAM